MQTVDNLNKLYGAPGRIVFRPGHCGYPEVVLANRYGTAEIALYGANVLSYRPTGHAPVIFRPSKRDYKPGESFHGGIPVCWPQFGRLTNPSLPQHGFARTMPFEVRGTQYSEEMTEITLALQPTAETKKVFPYDFDLEVKITVSMKLNLSLKTKNTGTSAFSFTGGFHPYLLVRNRDDVVIKGLDGVPYVRADKQTNHVQMGDLCMTTDTDHVFELTPAPKHEFALLDDGLRRAIALVGSGHSSLVVWNPGSGNPLADFEPDDWRKFVCVEPVTHWPDAIKALEPGETHELIVAIQSSAH